MQKMPEHVEQWHYKGITVCGTDVLLTAEEVGDKGCEEVFLEPVYDGEKTLVTLMGFRIKNPVGLLFADPTLNGLAQLAVRRQKEPSVVFDLFTRLLVTKKLTIGSPNLARHILVTLKETFGIDTDEEELYFQVSYILILMRKLDDRLLIVQK